MTHDVFVSYSSKDKTIADSIVAALENNKIRCWYAPRDIKPSEDWGKAITSAIEGCKVFLIIFSGNANHSQRVLDEVNLAISQQTVIFPFRIENLEPQGAMKLHLSSRHWLDAYDPSWESHIKKLIKEVSANLETTLDEQDIVVSAGIERKTKQQKKLTRILAGVAAGALLITAGWYGLPLLNNWVGETSAFPETATTTPQERTVTEEPEKTDTPEPATPGPTLTPTLYDSTVELGTPDYETDFSSSVLDIEVWPIGKRDVDGNVYYGLDGTLIVQNIQTPLYYGEKTFINSIVEVDAMLLSKGNSKGIIQLMCRSGEGKGGYIAHFDSTGEIFIERHTPPYEIYISSGKVAPFSLNKYYRLRFDCVGSDFRAYVNGSLVARGSDTSFYFGTLGLSSEGYPKCEVAFDNFKLWLP
jgi:hypothetical protein